VGLSQIKAKIFKSAPVQTQVVQAVLTPARTRWMALKVLWWYRNVCEDKAVRDIRTEERNRELHETMPFMCVAAFVTGLLMFVALPGSLAEESALILGTVWPLFVVQIAPMLAAQSMALLNAPHIALRLTAMTDAGQFSGGPIQRASQIAAVTVPWIQAHAMVSMVGLVILVLFTLLFGMLGSFVLNVGDLRSLLDMALSKVSPSMWLRALFTAWLLGLACTLASVLYAWPGSQTSANTSDAHRIGVRTMIAASVTCALVGMVINRVAALFGWNPLA
jgi:hypothetical protein